MKTLGLIGGALVLVSAVVACSSRDSSSSGSGGASYGGTGGVGATGGQGATGGSVATGGQTSTGGTGGTAGQTSTGGTGATGGGGGTGGDAGACKPPTTLHPPNADAGTKNLYCPFSGADGGKNEYCDTATEHCCEPKSGTSSCVAQGTACGSGDTDWGCEDPADCGTGMQCCGTGTLVKNTDSQCANYASGFTGTHCAASCATGEIQMCTSDGECQNGQTCLPFSTKGNQVGGCYGP